MTAGLPGAFTASGFDLVPLGGETFGDVTGSIDDRVVLKLGDETVVVAESYSVEQSILTQPSHFTLKLGWGAVLQGLIAKATPGTPFKLFIGDVPRFVGAIDGYEATSDATAGGSLTIHGRDNLGPIHDAFVTKETSYQDATYFDMVAAVLKDIYGDFTLSASNNANRKLTTGIGVKPTRGVSPDPNQASTGPTAKQLRTRIGERRYEFVKRELDRAGLFLWAAADGSFVLSEPNGNQSPIYRIVRQRGQTRNAVNVLSVRYRNASEGRYTEATIYGRGGGKKFGPTKTHGDFADPEMQEWFPDHPRPLVLKDTNCTNNEQAAFYARRKLAETRRAGWSLVYTVAGSTVPAIGSASRAVWTPDTVVSVDDQELGVSGNFYIEKVAFRRSPQTTTELTLMRPSDLVFGSDEATP